MRSPLIPPPQYDNNFEFIVALVNRVMLNSLPLSHLLGARTGKNFTLLMIVTTGDRPELIRRLLMGLPIPERLFNMLEVRDDYGNNVIMHACKRAKLGALMALLRIFHACAPAYTPGPGGAKARLEDLGGITAETAENFDHPVQNMLAAFVADPAQAVKKQQQQQQQQQEPEPVAASAGVGYAHLRPAIALTPGTTFVGVSLEQDEEEALEKQGRGAGRGKGSAGGGGKRGGGKSGYKQMFDQFEANERLFGIKADSYHPDLYSTPVDSSGIGAEEAEDVARRAAEMDAADAAKRGAGEEEDEEGAFSAVGRGRKRR